MALDHKQRIMLIAGDIPWVKEDLVELSDTYYEVGTIYATAMLCSRICEKIIKTIFLASGTTKIPHNLDGMIQELVQTGQAPLEIGSCMHMTRIYGNKSRHGAEGFTYLEEDSFILLECLIRILMWYKSYCVGKIIPKSDHNYEYRTIHIWSDIADAFIKKIINRAKGNFDHSSLFNIIYECHDLLRLDLVSNDIIMLIVTDATKLSESIKIRAMLNKRLEKFVSNGGTLIGFHDIIYRRCRNEVLESVFGCQINEFRRLDLPVKYIKTDDCGSFSSLKHLPNDFEIADGEICWGTWADDSLPLFVSEEAIPLVTFREYGDGCAIWINSGDYKASPPQSLSKPQKEFISLLSSLLKFAINKDWSAG